MFRNGYPYNISEVVLDILWRSLLREIYRLWSAHDMLWGTGGMLWTTPWGYVVGDMLWTTAKIYVVGHMGVTHNI